MIAIKIENLSKQYRLGLVSTRTLSHDLNRWYQTTIRGKDDPYLKIGEVERERGSDEIFTAEALRREENDISLRLSASAVKDSQRLCASAVKNKTALANLQSSPRDDRPGEHLYERRDHGVLLMN